MIAEPSAVKRVVRPLDRFDVEQPPVIGLADIAEQPDDSADRPGHPGHHGAAQSRAGLTNDQRASAAASTLTAA